MTDLVDFLLARIAEDEEAWRGGLGLTTRPDFAKLSRHMLADCEAKRRIVEQSHILSRHGSGRVLAPDMRWVLASLALPYADHPDYREEWRPE